MSSPKSNTAPSTNPTAKKVSPKMVQKKGADPLVSARKAMRLMNTNYLPAFGTGPPRLFVSNKMSHAELPYVLEIVNHTHTILGSVPLIQVFQPGARKAITTEAVPDSTLPYLLTVLDSARDAGFRFDTVVASATGARLLISLICAAEATVHSAGSDQRRANRICLCRFFGHPVCVLGWLMWVPQF
jgi:hypothetical protein